MEDDKNHRIMQVFIIGTPLETAMALDAKRLNKQIIEGNQIMKAIVGETKAWANHPCTLMYRAKGYDIWLNAYLICLESYKNKDMEQAEEWNRVASRFAPPFHQKAYFNQMKRRLFTKNPEHYHQWEHLGTSDENWYFVDGEWRYYRNGKRISDEELIPMF
jgi:hypothetical protein